MDTKKILIVEDEKSLIDALQEKLKDEGYSVLTARNGEEGLEVALTNQPDLILLDLVMPVMSGMTMLKKLREDSWGETVSVIVLTNLTDVKEQREALEVNTENYLVKSDWSLSDVIKKVKEILEK